MALVPTVDVLVAGAGPAGLAAASQCARRGLDVLLVAPSLRVWPATYCLWGDEIDPVLPALALDSQLEFTQSYQRTLARTASGAHHLRSSYRRVRSDVLHPALLALFEARGGRAHVPGRVVSTTPAAGRAGRVRAVLDDDTEVDAAVVLDASGASAARAGGARRSPAQQRAWGERVTGADGLVPPGTALFMDWATLPGVGVTDPFFLYGLGLDDGSTLLEVTSLAGAPPVPLPRLRDALHRLLRAHGLSSQGPAERVAIPLDVLPRRAQDGVVPVGVAAGLVHPATGYSVATSLRLADPLARALAGALDGSGAATGPGAATRAADRVLWPAGRVATAALLRLGLDVLLPLDAAASATFFTAFLDLPEQRWRRYLSLEAAPADIAGTMAAAFAALPPALRAHIAATVARRAVPGR